MAPAGRGPWTFTQRFDHRVDVVFDYLSDPRNRPEWQLSLRRVEILTEQATGEGARWRDIAWGGVRSELEVVTHDPPRAWAEQGEWHGISGYLALILTPLGLETDVDVVVRLQGRGLRQLLVELGGLVLPIALSHDLKRADRLLTARRSDL